MRQLLDSSYAGTASGNTSMRNALVELISCDVFTSHCHTRSLPAVRYDPYVTVNTYTAIKRN